LYRVYEICEILPDGSRLKIALVSGLEHAKSRLEGLAKNTINECFAADANTRQIVAHRNVPLSRWRSTKRIFQIAYNEEEARARAELLSGLGYGIVSAFSNQAARLLLSSIQHYDLFIVGHAAPEQTRNEMVEWLKENYPDVRILALNPPHEQLPRADYNVLRDGSLEDWPPFLTHRKAAS
jgi:CheY-like chemotaxis protein